MNQSQRSLLNLSISPKSKKPRDRSAHFELLNRHPLCWCLRLALFPMARITPPKQGKSIRRNQELSKVRSAFPKAAEEKKERTKKVQQRPAVKKIQGTPTSHSN